MTQLVLVLTSSVGVTEVPIMTQLVLVLTSSVGVTEVPIMTQLVLVLTSSVGVTEVPIMTQLVLVLTSSVGVTEVPIMTQLVLVLTSSVGVTEVPIMTQLVLVLTSSVGVTEVPIMTQLVLVLTSSVGIVLSAKKADIRKNGCCRIEEMRRDSRKQTEKPQHAIVNYCHNQTFCFRPQLKRRVDKVTLVMDLEHFSMRNLLMPGMDIILQIMGQTEANYPETLKIAFIVNAPRIFPLIFKACKLFLSEDTKKKINLLGSNWKERLVEGIDPSELPQHWGGTVTDPDGDVYCRSKHWGGTVTDPDGDVYCRSKVCMGGDVPELFHVKPEALVDMDRVMTIIVPRSSSRDVKIDMKETGKVLRWVFWSDDYDIKFKVSFKSSLSEEMETLKRLTRVQCHLVPENDIMECSNTGTYFLTFDNTYSWLHKKKVFYVVDVLDGQLTDNTTSSCHTMP
ncbi:SEC14-like protein 2 [Lamellibrachia satsuma]|nr:SEC14-like protein 2 [Lamellibrachia satsuma]